MFLYIKIYVAQQLHLTFTDENDCDTIEETLAIGFRALLEQSYDLLALLPDKAIGSNDTVQVDEVMHDEAAKEHEGTELSEEEKRKRNQKKRIKYLKELVEWLEYYFGTSQMVPDPADSSESEKNDTDSSDLDSSDFDSNPDWTDSDGSDIDTPKL